MKKVELVYYSANPSKNNTGFKHVLFEITDPSGVVTHDWGFADWMGEEWGTVEVPEGYTSKVVYWAYTLNPELLLKEDSKIIRI